jgi:hypothetical protein
MTVSDRHGNQGDAEPCPSPFVYFFQKFKSRVYMHEQGKAMQGFCGRISQLKSINNTSESLDFGSLPNPGD